MPDQSQGSESTVFQVDRTVSGSSYMPSFKVLRAETAKSRIPSKNRLQDINNHNNLVKKKKKKKKKKPPRFSQHMLSQILH